MQRGSGHAHAGVQCATRIQVRLGERGRKGVRVEGQLIVERDRPGDRERHGVQFARPGHTHLEPGLPRRGEFVLQGRHPLGPVHGGVGGAADHRNARVLREPADEVLPVTVGLDVGADEGCGVVCADRGEPRPLQQRHLPGVRAGRQGRHIRRLDHGDVAAVARQQQPGAQPGDPGPDHDDLVRLPVGELGGGHGPMVGSPQRRHARQSNPDPDPARGG